VDNVVKIAKALSDVNRLRILNALYKNGELCACQISELLEISSPSVSRHMDLLKSAGFISAKKEGKWVFYTLSKNIEDGGELEKIFSWVLSQFISSKQIKEDDEKLETIVSCLSFEFCKKYKRGKNEN